MYIKTTPRKTTPQSLVLQYHACLRTSDAFEPTQFLILLSGILTFAQDEKIGRRSYRYACCIT